MTAEQDRELAVWTRPVPLRPIVSSLLFTALGLWEALGGIGPSWLGWSVALLFGSMTTVLVQARARGPIRLIAFDTQGLVTRWGGRVPWHAITQIATGRRAGQRFLAVSVDDVHRQRDDVVHARHRNRVERRPETPDIMVWERSLGYSLDEFATRVLALAPAGERIRLTRA